jgi:enoyl-[acyl-carrier protein] reductase II
LRYHIQQAKANLGEIPFGVNVPIFSKYAEEQMRVIVEEGVKIVFSAAGSAGKYTQMLHDQGIVVAHVVPSVAMAEKATAAGVDLIVCEGFEAGGHNGRDETTTMVLVPLVRAATHLPLLAAGGIGSGAAMLAAMALGADGVQVGSAFAVAEESSAHPNYKKAVVEAKEGDTRLLLKSIVPTRMLNSPLAQAIQVLESQGATKEALEEYAGHGLAMRGIFEGDYETGEMEVGQVSAQLHRVEPAAEIFKRILKEYQAARIRLAL